MPRLVLAVAAAGLLAVAGACHKGQVMDPTPDTSTAPEPNQDSAFALVKQQFAGAFGGMNLVQPEVRWWSNICPNSTATAVILNGTCYAGIGYRPKAIDVAWRGTIGTSAYSHELMHYYLQSLQGDSDPQHAQLPMWELVAATDTMLQNQGM